MNTEEALQPHRPQQMFEHAEACLLALSARGLGRRISLGDALGLVHWIRDLRFEDVLMD